MSKGSSLVMVLQVWNDDTGERIDVGEDRDGLGLMEIRYVDEKGKVGADIRFLPEHAHLLTEAISRVADFLQKRETP